GKHKGFGLALMGELLTTVMSGGVMIDKKDEVDFFGYGSHIYDQTAIVIKQDVFLPMREYKERVSALKKFIKMKNSNVRLPGERSYAKKVKLEKEGLDLDENLIKSLNRWAGKYGVSNLI